MGRVPSAEDDAGAEPHRGLANRTGDGDQAARAPRVQDTEALAAEFHVAVERCREALRAYVGAVYQAETAARRLDRKLRRGPQRHGRSSEEGEPPQNRR